jgi:hypothetical protein
MAKFNPDVPQPNDPNYLSYSRGIEADKSLGTLFSGVGNLFEGAVKGGVKLLESGISEELRNRIHPLRDQHEAGIEATRDAVTGLQGKTAQMRATQALLPGQTDETPPPIEGMSQRVRALEGARANGKVSETYYMGSLNQIAKEFRARYPGFREYVDKEIKEITGRDPANAYVASMIADINAYTTGRDKDLDRINTFMKQNIELPDMDKVIAARNNGLVDDNYVYQYVNRNRVGDFQHKKFEQEIQQRKMSRGEAAHFAGIDSGNEAVKIATNKFNNLTVDIFGTDQKIEEIARDALTGKKKYTDAQWQGIGEGVGRARKQAEIEIGEFLNRPVKGPDGRITSRRQLMGEEKTKELITGAMQQWQLVQDAITNKDGGLAYHHATQVQKIEGDEQYNLLHNKTLGGIARLSAAVGKNPVFQQAITEKAIDSRLPSHLKGYVDEVNKRIGTQQGATPGNPVTLKDSMDRLNRTAEENPRMQNDPAVEKARNEILMIPLMIPNPQIEDEAKVNIINGAFDPKNKGILDNIVRDYTKDGKSISGRFMAFKRMASADIGAEVMRLDKLYPQHNLAQKYTDWTETTFRSLVTKELADFDSIVASQHHEVSWDDKNHRFDIRFKRPEGAFEGGLGSRDRENFMSARAAINRLNLSLEPMKSVAEVSGRNVDAYLLDTLVSARNTGKLEGVSNLPQFLMNAVMASKLAKEKREKAGKAWTGE